MNVLILSATASAINYIYSLEDREDINLYVTDITPFAAGLYRPNVVPLIIPRSRNFEEYRQALDSIIEQHEIDIMIPTSDHDMQGVAYLRKQGWHPKVKMFEFDPDLLFLYVDKSEVIKRLDKLGFTVPKVFDSADQYNYPVVIKPIMEGGSKGVSIVKNRDQFESRKNELIKTYGERFVVQEYIPGSTGSIYVALLLYDQEGKLWGEALSHSTLTYMSWGGGGNAGELAFERSALDLAKEIIAALGGWRGPINLEFKKHQQTGDFYLMEINCRLNGYSYLTSMNGLNFPAAIIDILSGNSTARLNCPVPGETVNFVMGVREKIVERWIDKSSSEN